eukprot:4047194-Alexandrium_andersonii.AAC.1
MAFGRGRRAGAPWLHSQPGQRVFFTQPRARPQARGARGRLRVHRARWRPRVDSRTDGKAFPTRSRGSARWRP